MAGKILQMCPLILQILTYILNFKWRSFKIENKRYYRSFLCDKKCECWKLKIPQSIIRLLIWRLVKILLNREVSTMVLYDRIGEFSTHCWKDWINYCFWVESDISSRCLSRVGFVPVGKKGTEWVSRYFPWKNNGRNIREEIATQWRKLYYITICFYVWWHLLQCLCV